MLPNQWTSPCDSQCTHKFSALTQIPWRVFCKKGCSSDGKTWEECLEGCEETCFKDPVLEDREWSAYIDRSPGLRNYSQECFHSCVAGCGYKFEVDSKTVDRAHPNRPQSPPSPSQKAPQSPRKPGSSA